MRRRLNPLIFVGAFGDGRCDYALARRAVSWVSGDATVSASVMSNSLFGDGSMSVHDALDVVLRPAYFPSYASLSNPAALTSATCSTNPSACGCMVRRTASAMGEDR